MAGSLTRFVPLSRWRPGLEAGAVVLYSIASIHAALETTMPAASHYAVHLECPSLPMNRRIQAEVRFAKSLERALGGSQGVVDAYSAWVSATEDSAEEPSPAVLAAVRRWQRAADAARQAGLQEVGEAEEAYFEVRVVETAESET
jgi:hypothetical protein